MANDERSRDSATQQHRPEAEKTTNVPPGQRKAGAEQGDLEEIMRIRKAAGSIAEVIEPVTRTRQERTDQ
jgi:hypothetical protein